MKGWKLTKPLTLTEQEITVKEKTNKTKVKVTKALLTLSDVLNFSNEESNNMVLGSYGIGIVSEVNSNLFGIEKGSHVYIEPNHPCGECFNCKNDEQIKCSNMQTAGEDYNGFLSDFVMADPSSLYLLPNSVSNFSALFISHISLAISVIDELGIQKGDYVSIIGGNNFANILTQLLIYYQAVPILATLNEEDYQIAKESGIYYVLGPEDSWQKEVSSITGGRMTKFVVYVSDCNIPTNKAFALASYNAGIAFTGTSYKNLSLPTAQAMKKQLDIHFINSGYGNTATSINLIANKALDLSHLKLDSTTFDNVPNTLHSMLKNLEENDKIYETIVDLI
ncbi:MAG: alcohol dehydrogenase catalytic domain-containing protein [Clostridia bacterium]|nr:alcohol dehydrogenase catalytic domain-containing protein [Clostridia bacterium]